MFYTLYLILFCSFFLRSEFPILVIHRPGLMFKFQILVFTFHQRYMAKSWNCLIFSINPPKLVMIIHFSKLVTCLGILLILLVMLEYLLGGYVFFIFPFLKFFYANKQFLSISYLILHSLIFTIRALEILWLNGNLVILFYRVYIFMFWSQHCLRIIKDVPGRFSNFLHLFTEEF